MEIDIDNIIKDFLKFTKANLIKIISIFLIVFALFESVFIIHPGREGVILRFKKYNRTVQPGMQFKIPLLESVKIVNKYKSRRTELGSKDLYGNNILLNSSISTNNTLFSKTMITQDENIVLTQVTVLWNLSNTKDYLFNLDNVEGSIKDIAEAVLRDIVSSSKLIDVISNKKYEIESEIKEQLQKIMNLYESGVNILQIQLLKASSPTQETEHAYRQVQAAKSKKEQLINIGHEYENKRINTGKANKETIILDSQKFFQTKKGNIEKFYKEVKELYKVYSTLNEKEKEEFLNIIHKDYTAKILEGKQINIVPDQTFNHKKV